MMNINIDFHGVNPTACTKHDRVLDRINIR